MPCLLSRKISETWLLLICFLVFELDLTSRDAILFYSSSLNGSSNGVTI